MKNTSARIYWTTPIRIFRDCQHMCGFIKNYANKEEVGTVIHTSLASWRLCCRCTKEDSRMKCPAHSGEMNAVDAKR